MLQEEEEDQIVEREEDKIITNGSQEEVINHEGTTRGDHIREVAFVVEEGHIIHGVAGTRLEDGHIDANN